MVKLNIAYPPYGSSQLLLKVIEKDDEKKLRVFLEKRLTDSLEEQKAIILNAEHYKHKQNPEGLTLRRKLGIAKIANSHHRTRKTSTTTILNTLGTYKMTSPKQSKPSKEELSAQKSQKQQQSIFQKQKAKQNQPHKTNDGHLGKRYGR